MWRNIFATVMQLIVSSSNAWKRIDNEKRSLNEFLNKFLHPIFGLIALTSFVGGLWFAKNGGVENALKLAIINLVSVYGGYFISSYVINELASRYKVRKNISRFRLFSGYSSVVLYLLYLITPFLSGFYIVWAFVLYTIVIVNSGAIHYLKVDNKYRVNLVLAASALVVFVPMAISMLLTFTIN